MKTQILSIIVCICFSLLACGSNEKSEESFIQATESSDAFAMTGETDETIAEKQAESSPTKLKSTNAIENPQAASRKIIYIADARMQVDNLKEAKEKLYAILRKYKKSYRSTEKLSKSYYEERMNFSIRVPVEDFSAVLSEIENLANYIDSRNIVAKDVSQEYVDASARLVSKQAAEKQYFTILQRAGTIGDILAVQKELRKIREEIESLQGRLKYLKNQSSFSTINLTIYTPVEGQKPPQDGFFYKLKKSLGNGWDGMISFILGLLTIWPILLLLIPIIYYARVRIKRKKQSQ